jgi:hypothetical protein
MCALLSGWDRWRRAVFRMSEGWTLCYSTTQVMYSWNVWEWVEDGFLFKTGVNDSKSKGIQKCEVAYQKNSSIRLSWTGTACVKNRDV